jgi:uncharacterized protein (DUF1800 family)
MDRLKLRMLSAILLAAPILHGAASITVTPNNESTVTGGTRQYTATVMGLTNSAVDWYVNNILNGNATFGTVSTAGLFTAPMSVPNYVITITAVSQADPTVKGSVTATIKTPGPVLSTISPTTTPYGQFTLTCTGTGFTANALIWVNGTQYPTTVTNSTKVSAVVGIYSTGGNLVRVINPGSMFSNMLTLYTTGQTGSGTPVMSPASASVVQGLTQQFQAQIYGAAQTAVWTVSGGGTITQAGLYTAPAQIPNPATVTISATLNGQTISGNATIVSNVPPAITQVSQASIPNGVFSVTLTGTNFTSSSAVTLGGSPLAMQPGNATTMTVSGFTMLSGMQNLMVSNGPIAGPPFPVQVGVANPLVTASTARRFLQQAAFGPTPNEAAHLQQVGIDAWLTEQFNTPRIANYQNIGNQGGMGTRFMTNAVMQPDQLRQKVGFALSQIFVTSLVKEIWNDHISGYQEMLMTDAFKSYRQILADVTLSPTMGHYLDMANNAKGNAAQTILPNENYAREVLQLFSIGTWQLNDDGSQKLDAQNLRIPTYDQHAIAEFARVFTGWTFVPTNGTVPYWNAYINMSGPLVSIASFHDNGSKTLLNGQVNPAGLTPAADLNAALDNIASHANVGPFICRQLIQHLVKSNPSKPYVQRVVNVFNNAGNPQGRGDMQAVVAAILTDQEARANDTGLAQVANDGHLQEPALYLAAMIRAFGGVMNDQNYWSWELMQLSQDIYNSASVFNYYSPGYTIPQSGGLGGPEFQIFTPWTSIYRYNKAAGMFSAYQNPVQTYGPGTIVDLTPLVSLGSNPAALVDALDFTLTAGLMPAQMKQILVNAVTTETGGNVARIETGIYLILSSGYYNVWH